MKVINFETAKLANEKGYNEPCRFRYVREYKGSFKKYDGEFKENHYLCDESTKAYVDEKYGIYTDGKWDYRGRPHLIVAPYQHQLQKWIRENHNIDVDVTRDIEVAYQNETLWIVTISNFNNVQEIKTSIAILKHPEHYHINDFKSFEDAMEAGLKKALEII